MDKVFVEAAALFLRLLFELCLELLWEAQIVRNGFLVFHNELIFTFSLHHVNTMIIPNSLDAKEIPNRYDVTPMADKEQPRSIRFPQSLWDAIDRDAMRCGRSSVKQMEALLSVYYGLRDVEINNELLRQMGGLPVAPRSASNGIPLMNSKRRSDAPHKKKNKRVA